ncbi:MAG: hypothetical protein ABR584_09930 [Candidatus Baltobacteraceae bacterium]
MMRDFESYYAAGQTWAAHRDPYSTDIWKFEQTVPGVEVARGELLPFVGPAAFLPLWALLASLAFPLAVVFWGTILVACAAAILVAILRSTNALSMGAMLAGACIFVGFGPFTSDLALGQAALLSFAACVGATLWFDRLPLLGGVWSFFAAMQPNIALALLSQVRKRRTWAPLLSAAVFFLVLSLGASGLHGFLSYFGTLIAHGQAERFVLIQITPAAIGYGFGLPVIAAGFIGSLATVAAAIVALAVLRSPYIKQLWKLAILCTLLPLAIPFFHEHDFVVVLLACLLCAVLAENRNWTLASTGTLLCAIDWLGLAQRPDGLLQSFLLAVGLLLGLFAIAEQPARRLLLPSGVLVVLLAAGILAQHHRAPVWPHDMHGVTAMSGPIAEIWHSELERTGQFARDPFWAAMRLLTLCGSALLAWASISTSQQRDQLDMS